MGSPRSSYVMENKMFFCPLEQRLPSSSFQLVVLRKEIQPVSKKLDAYNFVFFHAKKKQVSNSKSGYSCSLY
jgi:hypothetical protein